MGSEDVYKRQEIGKLTDNKTLKVYVPGMGNGHDAAFFAQHGHQTIGGDLSEKAVENAQTKYQTLDLIDFQVLDAIHNENPKEIDLVFDRAMFCALPASIENLYLESCAKKLKKTGIFASVLFTKVDSENGPPWEIPVEDFSLKMNKLGFELAFRQDIPVTYKSTFILHESVVIFMRSIIF